MAEIANAGQFRAILAAAFLERGMNRLSSRMQSTEAYAFEIGCEMPEIATPHAFRAEERLIVALMSGDDRPNPGRLAAAVGVEIGDVDQKLVRAGAEWAISGLEPPEPLTPIDVFMDAKLFRSMKSGPSWKSDKRGSNRTIASSDATEANVVELTKT